MFFLVKNENETFGRLRNLDAEKFAVLIQPQKFHAAKISQDIQGGGKGYQLD